MKKKEGKVNLEDVKKIAKETKNQELASDVKRRIKNGNTVNKWQR